MRTKFKVRNILFLVLGLGLILTVTLAVFGNIRWVIILSILCLYVLLLIFPLPLSRKQKQLFGQKILRNAKSDYLLVISLSNISSASKRGDFFANDWSYAWANTLFQEVGNFAICEVEDLARGLEDRRVVIISRSAIKQVYEALKQKLLRYIHEGGMVILERPDNLWSFISGLSFSNEQKDLKKITYVNEKYLDEPYRTYLSQLPINSYMHVVRERTNDVEVILDIDEMSAICLRPLGSGAVLSINFNYGLELISIQQGIPSTRDYKVNRNLLQTQDLVLAEELKDNTVPYADLLEKFIFRIIDSRLAAFRWWYFPKGYTGACIVTHDCEAMGEALLKTPQLENKMGVRSTYFLIWNSPISFQAINELRSLGADVQIHWDRNFKRRIGGHLLAFFKNMRIPIMQKIYCSIDNLRVIPLKKEVRLSEQKERLLQKSEGEIAVNRLHTLRWGDHYTYPFRVMDYCGLKADSSYGPNCNAKGYLFGTGLPFYPLDTNGFIIPVLEVPFQTQDARANANIDFLRKLFTESQNLFHQAIVTNYHPDKCPPQSEIEKQWQQTFVVAGECLHWITTLSDFLDFFRTRSRNLLQSKIRDGCLQVSVQIDHEASALFFPKVHLGEDEPEVILDGQRINPELFELMGEEMLMVGIPQGEHKLKIRLAKG